MLQGSNEGTFGAWYLTSTSCAWINLALIYTFLLIQEIIFTLVASMPINWCWLLSTYSKDLNLPLSPHKSNVPAVNYCNHWHEKRWLTAFKFQRVLSILMPCQFKPPPLVSVTCLALHPLKLPKIHFALLVTRWDCGTSTAIAFKTLENYL